MNELADSARALGRLVFELAGQVDDDAIEHAPAVWSADHRRAIDARSISAVEHLRAVGRELHLIAADLYMLDDTRRRVSSAASQGKGDSDE